MVLDNRGYSVNGAKVFIREPTDDQLKMEDADPEDYLDQPDEQTQVVAKGESGCVQSLQVYGGHLHIQAWTGSHEGEGWMTFIRIPMLAKNSARTEVKELAEPYGLTAESSLENVSEVLEREVDDYGRVNLGRERAGDTVKLAVLDEE